MKNFKKIKLLIAIIMFIVLAMSSSTIFASIHHYYGGVDYFCSSSYVAIPAYIGGTHYLVGYTANTKSPGDAYYTTGAGYPGGDINMGEALGFRFAYPEIFGNANLAGAFWYYGWNPGYRRTDAGAVMDLVDCVTYYNRFRKKYLTSGNELNAKMQSGSSLTMIDSNGNVVIGPLKATWAQESHYGIAFSEYKSKVIEYHNSGDPDSTWNSLETGVTLLSSDGTVITGGIPNGKEFYIQYPYSSYSNIDNIRVKVDLEYIASAEGYATEYYTYTSSGVSGVTQKMVRYPYSSDGGKYINGWVNKKTKTIEANISVDLEKIEIAGSVWRDGEADKATQVNGSYDNLVDSNGNRIDHLLNGIEVWLYEVVSSSDKYDLYINGLYLKRATLNKELGNLGIVDKYEVANPQLTRYMVNTDTGAYENGRYSFKGIDPTKKYIVMFVYDGMIYTNTYGAGIPEYNSDEWIKSSKGSELISDRSALNNQFAIIESHPDSYITDNPNLFEYPIHLNTVGEDKYNKVYASRSDAEKDYDIQDFPYTFIRQQIFNQQFLYDRR